MSQALEELLALLRLEQIEQNLYRGQSQDLGFGAVFGGQVLGQALSAAAYTVPPDRDVHSLHGYFLRPGDASKPVVYDVDCIRDGKSFTTRRVVAIQNGRAIFNLAASFQKHEPGFEHQFEMPEVPGPDGLASEAEILRQLDERISPRVRARLRRDRPIEIRPVAWTDPLEPEAHPPRKCVWFRADDALPDESAVHRYLLAYASDFHFLPTALQPHAESPMTGRVQIASLDHAMWFHRPFRFDDWLLYAIDSPAARGARGLVRGQIFDRAGALVASTAQEGLIRRRHSSGRTSDKD